MVGSSAPSRFHTYSSSLLSYQYCVTYGEVKWAKGEKCTIFNFFQEFYILDDFVPVVV